MLVFRPDNLTMSSKFAVKLWCGLQLLEMLRLTLIKWVDIFAYNGQPKSPQEHIDQIPSSLCQATQFICVPMPTYILTVNSKESKKI